MQFDQSDARASPRAVLQLSSPSAHMECMLLAQEQLQLGSTQTRCCYRSSHSVGVGHRICYAYKTSSCESMKEGAGAT
eukprot:6176915-Pleurochrysis_carterae.AAC.2